MTSFFHKQTIILRNRYSECLACGLRFVTERDAAMHMLQEEHKQNLNECLYLAEFPNVTIRQAQDDYFCEIYPPRPEDHQFAWSHANESLHVYGIILYECLGSDVYIYKGVAVKKDAWHGIVNKKCIFCNVYIEVNDFDDHIKKPEHLAKITTDDIEFQGTRGLYRILRKSFQCLICNIIYKLVPTSIYACISTHYLHGVHRAQTDILNKIATEAEERSMLKQIYPEKIVKTYDANTLIVKKEPMSNVVVHTFSIEIPIIGGTDIVVNGNIVIDNFSYHLIGNRSRRCAACDVKMHGNQQVQFHKESNHHKEAMKNIPVVFINTPDEEFIREPRPGMFHCGYCNSLERGFDNLMEHLESLIHKNARIGSAWRLHVFRVNRDQR